MGTSAELHLQGPGLLGPLPRTALAGGPAFPALARLLSRADPRAGPAPPLFQPSRLPPGPVALLGVGGHPGAQWWFRARPVHLRADRDRLLLFAGDAVAPSPDETAELVGAFNGLFTDRGLELVERAGHWFLRCAEPPEVELDSLEAVAGRYLDQHLPSGPDARSWRAILNEAQMLFHGLACNARRSERGRPEINGLWAWGGGRLDVAGVRAAVDSVFADCPELRGMAILAGLSPRPAPSGYPAMASTGGTCLVHLEAPAAALGEHDLDAWELAMADLERDWAAPLLAALQGRSLARLVIDAGADRHWCLTPGGLRRFWRPVRPLARWLDGEGEQ